MTIRPNKSILCFTVGIILAVSHALNSQGNQLDRANLISLQLEVLNELAGPVSENTFIQAQKIFVRGTLFNMEIMDAADNLRQAQAITQAMESSADYDGLIKAKEDEANAQQRYEELIASSNGKTALSGALQAISVEVHDADGTRIDIPLNRLTDASRIGIQEADPDGMRMVFLYEINSEQLPIDKYQLQAIAKEFSISRTVDFKIISSVEATGEQRCAAAYVNARVAASREDHDNAIRLAREAIENGPPLDYVVMASFRLLGDEYSLIGEYQQSLDAYQQALEILTQAFPKSDLPVLLESKIRKIKEQLGQ